MDTVDAPTDRRNGRPGRPAVLVGVLVVALAVIAGVVLSGNGRHHTDTAGAGGTSGQGTLPGLRGDRGPDQGGAGRFHAPDADLLVLDGVAGRVQVTADSDADEVSGTFRDSHHDPDDGDGAGEAGTVRTVVDSAGGRRTVTVVCVAGDGKATRPCAGDLSVTVPAHTGLRLRQTSGETVLDGLGGRLTVAVASDRLTARNLRAPAADVTVTSGSADVGFAAAPGTLVVRATSASMALRLPAAPEDAYDLTSSATSADVRIQVPRRVGAPRHVALHVLSGSLAVLPA